MLARISAIQARLRQRAAHAFRNLPSQVCWWSSEVCFSSTRSLLCPAQRELSKRELRLVAIALDLETASLILGLRTWLTTSRCLPRAPLLAEGRPLRLTPRALQIPENDRTPMRVTAPRI